MPVASPPMRHCLPVLAVLAAVLAGCGGSSKPGGPTPISLALDFTPNAAHAPIYAAGRTVGVTGLPSDVAVLNAVVSGDGGNFSAVKQHTIGFSAVPQMVAGKVDAVTAFWNAEGVTLQIRGVKTSDFRVDKYGAPPYPEVVLFTKRSTLVKRRKDLQSLVAALTDGVNEVHAHPDAAVEQIAKVSNADVPLV